MDAVGPFDEEASVGERMLVFPQSVQADCAEHARVGPGVDDKVGIPQTFVTSQVRDGYHGRSAQADGEAQDTANLIGYPSRTAGTVFIQSPVPPNDDWVHLYPR
jgi:hypothetical protein